MAAFQSTTVREIPASGNQKIKTIVFQARSNELITLHDAPHGRTESQLETSIEIVQHVGVKSCDPAETLETEIQSLPDNRILEDCTVSYRISC